MIQEFNIPRRLSSMFINGEQEVSQNIIRNIARKICDYIALFGLIDFERKYPKKSTLFGKLECLDWKKMDKK